MKFFWSLGVSIAKKLIAIAEYLQPIAFVLLRLAIAGVFFRSGLTKIASWDNTILLFSEEYGVPFLDPEIAAYIATIFELSCPVLLAFGFATRLACLPLLGMTAVIEFTYEHDLSHQLWAAIFFVLLCTGPGKLSIDYLSRRKLKF